MQTSPISDASFIIAMSCIRKTQGAPVNQLFELIHASA